MKGMNIDLTFDQYQDLQDLISFAYRSNYRNDHCSETFDSMSDAVYDAKVTYLK